MTSKMNKIDAYERTPLTSAESLGSSTSITTAHDDDDGEKFYDAVTTTAANDDGFDDDDDNNNNHNYTYILYPQRYLVLASFCMLNFSNGWIWVTWSPITALVANYWNIDESKVDALSGIYMYVFVPTNVLSMWLVVNYLGLAKGLTVGGILNMVGAAIRYGGGALSLYFTLMSDYQIVYVGTFICALGQTFILPMVALMSGNWFGEMERATATSLGVLAYQLGMLIGLGSTVVIDFRLDQDSVNDTDDDGYDDELNPHVLDSYLKWQWIASMVALAMVMVFLRTDRPPTPPSEAAAELTGDQGIGVKYRESLYMIISNPSSRVFFFLFGLAIGVFYAIPTFLSQFMPSWSPRDQGLLGVIFQIAAVCGCFAAGKFVSWSRLNYKKVALFLLTGCLVSVKIYAISVYYESHVAMVACAGLGFFFSSFMSVGIEFGTALTFPADEAAVYGILDSTGELSGFLLVTLGGFMSQSNDHVMDTAFCCILVFLVALALLLLWCLKGSSRRPSNLPIAKSTSA